MPRGEPVVPNEDCSFDIGLAYARIARFSHAEKFRFIQNLWKSHAVFEFPKSIETSEKLPKVLVVIDLPGAGLFEVF